MGELAVLGSCGAFPEPGRACAGFLLSHNGFRIVLDLGYGAASRLFAHGLPDAVVATHEHPDHCADVSALGRAWHYTASATGRLPLHCTPGTVRRLAAMEPRPHPTELFEVHDLGAPADIGPFRLTTYPLPHHVPNFGVRLTAPGLTVAYTGDTGPSPTLADLGRDADLVICDATLRTPPAEGEPRFLMTATEAGQWAAAAGARRLMLTHFWPGTDRGAAAEEARAEFGGEVLVADEDLTVAL
ncbi:Metal-dependent hydrolases of the beta-lactamase superfamily III [Amycolatopsis camponoti]|uniref:Metal-dependent hydrolases of the beta-lactamase superfamily III n=1 Tax=Amycolatopsis camponoti TaxID=2606593 RepID=A0A6I8M8U1_9PSEU|nr:MBL fold metallo-hydrolase [Amycolatopsis camponoti]VVJ24367.1 Metal-dependent hydrolases of the beta-lactamase superfamily III [Amycolatopsis camponoti]